jgi:hypothetical protein
LQDRNKAGPIDPTRVIISRVDAARDVRGNFNTLAMAMAAAWRPNEPRVGSARGPVCQGQQDQAL